MRLGAVRQVTHFGFPGSHLGREVVPGYVLAGRIGKGRTGEVWAAVGPGGFAAALRFVPLPAGPGEAETRALEILRGVHHPNVVSTFGSFLLEGWLVLATERADATLLDRIRGEAAPGGIERGELIDWLAGAARGIDYLNLGDHDGGGRGAVGIQHGGIRPGNLHVVGGGLKVADPWAPQWLEGVFSRYRGVLLDPEYAAPEHFLGLATRRSDQYSLALTYCKLRGGRLPFSGSAEDLAPGHLSLAPDLTMIAEDERPAVARALAKDPEERWESCGAFLDTLRSDVMASTIRPLAPGLAAIETRGHAPAPVGARGPATFRPAPPEAGWSPTGQRTPGSSSAACPSTQLASGGTPDAAGVPPDRDADDVVPHPGSIVKERGRFESRRVLIAAVVSVAVVGLGVLAVRREGRSPGGEGADAVPDRPTPRVPRSIEPGEGRRLVSEPRKKESPPAAPTVKRAEVPGSNLTADRPAEERVGEPWRLPVSRAGDLIARLSRSVREGASTVASSWTRRHWPWVVFGSVSENLSHAREGSPSVGVVAPASLALEVPETLDVSSGRGAKLGLKVIRRGSTDPVEIRFEGMPRGISAPGVVLPGDRSEAECDFQIHREASIDPALIKVVASAGSLRADASVRLVPTPTPALEARSRGETLLGREEIGGALAAYRESVRLDPMDAASVLGLARTLFASGELEAANRAFDEAIRLDPANAQAFRYRGDVRSARGDRAGALGDYGEALRLRPEDSALWNKRGLLLARQGELHRAIADFDRAIGLDPRDAALHYNRGRVYERLGDAVEAIAEYDRAISLNPALAPAYRARASAHSRRGDPARARADQKEATRQERSASRSTPLAGPLRPSQTRGRRD